MNRARQNGFIALTSVIIISALLLLLVIGDNLHGFFARSNVLDSEFKKRSRGLAEACVDTALLKLAGDSSYSGNETIPVGSESCAIRQIQTSGGQKTIQTQGVYQNFYTNIQVTVDPVSLASISWEEIPAF